MRTQVPRRGHQQPTVSNGLAILVTGIIVGSALVFVTVAVLFFGAFRG